MTLTPTTQGWTKFHNLRTQSSFTQARTANLGFPRTPSFLAGWLQMWEFLLSFTLICYNDSPKLRKVLYFMITVLLSPREIRAIQREVAKHETSNVSSVKS
jgi:hypothetical protein